MIPRILLALGLLALPAGAQTLPSPTYGAVNLSADPASGGQAVRRSYLDARLAAALPGLAVCGLYAGTGAAGTAQGVTVATGLSCSAAALSVVYGTGAGTAAAGNDSRILGALQAASNLGDLASPASARTNLGLAAVAASGAYADLAGRPALGGAALLNVGTTAGSVADGGVVATNGTAIAANTAAIAARLVAASNLSDLVNTATARTNLGLATVAASGAYTDLSGRPALGSAAALNVGTTTGTVADGGVVAGNGTAIAARLVAASNLADLANPATARSNLGLAAVASSGAYADLSGRPTLGTAAALNAGSTTGTLADGGTVAANTTAIAARLVAASNLSDLANVATARTNLGLGGAATLAVGTAAGTVAAGNDSRITGALPASQRNAASGIPTLNNAAVLVPAPPPTQRPPSVTDDTSAGYKVGDLWLYQGRVWTAVQVTAGQAVWQAGGTGRARALDFGVASPIGAYGTVLLRTAYAGSAIGLKRGSDSTTLAVGFVNGLVDAAAADAFCSAAGDMAAGACFVTTIYDQSGAGNDCTQATTGNAPIWTTNTVGGLRAIAFHSTEAGTTVPRYCSLPSGTTFTSYSTSVAAIAQTRTTRMTSVLFNVGANIATFAKGNAAISTMALAINAANVPATVGQTGPAVTLFNLWTGSGSTYENNATGTLTYGTSGTTTGATIGSNSVGTYGPAEMDLVGLVVHAAHLFAADIANLRSALTTASGIAPQVRDVWVADGDSITAGFGATYLRGYARQGLELLTLPVRPYNIAQSGHTLANRVSNFSTTYPSGMYSASAPHFVVSVAICTNDLGTSGTTGAACYASLQTYVASIKALGSNVRVIVSTLLPRTGSGSLTTEIGSFNTALRAGWSGFADGLADFAADPTMGLSTAPSNTALYLDGLHPTDLGYAYLAPVMAAAVQGVLAK